MKALLFSVAVFGVVPVVLAQTPPANDQGRRIEDPGRFHDLPPARTDRQSHWADENATPAGAQVPGTNQPRAEFSPSAQEIRQYTAQLTDAALLPGGLKEAVGMLSLKDRSRLEKELSQRDLRSLDETLRQFQAQWTTRYGERFNLFRNPTAMAGYRILRGIYSPQDAVAASYRQDDKQASQTSPDGLSQEQAPAGEERNATMVVATDPSWKQPPLTVVFDNETTGGTNWHLKPADKLTAEKLDANLQARMKRMLEQSDTWPTDVREAYRLANYHVLAALEDQPLDQPKGQDTQRKTEPAIGS